MRRAVLTGTGSALPARRVSNAELAETVDTSDEWIVERTGIRFRHIAGPDETTGTLAADAARAALGAAGKAAAGIDLIVLATATPDQTFPATATKLHADGRHNELLYVDGGPSTTGTGGKVRMKGREVFRHAVTNLASVMDESLGAVGMTAADVDWVVPHQANARILDAP